LSWRRKTKGISMPRPAPCHDPRSRGRAPRRADPLGDARLLRGGRVP
jgi:hypothetical protein